MFEKVGKQEAKRVASCIRKPALREAQWGFGVGAKVEGFSRVLGLESRVPYLEEGGAIEAWLMITSGADSIIGRCLLGLTQHLIGQVSVKALLT